MIGALQVGKRRSVYEKCKKRKRKKKTIQNKDRSALSLVRKEPPLLWEAARKGEQGGPFAKLK